MSRVPLTRFNINLPNFASSNLLLSNSAEQATGGAFKLQDILNSQADYNEQSNTDDVLGKIAELNNLSTYAQDRQNIFQGLSGVDMSAVTAAADARGDLLSTREGEAYGRSQRRQEEALTAANLGLKEFELNNAPNKFAADIARTRGLTAQAAAATEGTLDQNALRLTQNTPEYLQKLQDNAVELAKAKKSIKGGTKANKRSADLSASGQADIFEFRTDAQTQAGIARMIEKFTPHFGGGSAGRDRVNDIVSQLIDPATGKLENPWFSTPFGNMEEVLTNAANMKKTQDTLAAERAQQELQNALKTE